MRENPRVMCLKNLDDGDALVEMQTFLRSWFEINRTGSILNVFSWKRP